MKRILIFILCISTIFTGCASNNSEKNTDITTEESTTAEQEVIKADPIEDVEPVYSDLKDEELLSSIEDRIYDEILDNLDSDEYVVENVQAVYISKEYVDELEFNSQSNVYFGYTLDELQNVFCGKKYVFTLGSDNQTGVKEYEVIEDVSEETIIKNVAIGSGVILVCVVVSAVTAGAGAPACAAIFAASAKTGAIMAVSSGALGGIGAGIVKGIETGDMDEALKAGALAGSEGFKWGAISGAIVGGGKEAFILKAGTKSGLTMNEVAIIQKEAKLPMDVVSEIHSIKEYEIYKQAGLKTAMINGKTALIPQNLDLNYVSELKNKDKIEKVTNLVRMQRGLAPIDPATGKQYELHHIGQKWNATLAVLTNEQHEKNYAILHIFGKKSEVDHAAFKSIREAFWKYIGNTLAKGGTL